MMPMAMENRNTVEVLGYGMDTKIIG